MSELKPERSSCLARLSLSQAAFIVGGHTLALKRCCERIWPHPSAALRPPLRVVQLWQMVKAGVNGAIQFYCCKLFNSGQMDKCVEARQIIQDERFWAEESEVDLQPAASGSCIEMKVALLLPCPWGWPWPLTFPFSAAVRRRDRRHWAINTVDAEGADLRDYFLRWWGFWDHAVPLLDICTQYYNIILFLLSIAKYFCVIYSLICLDRCLSPDSNRSSSYRHHI